MNHTTINVAFYISLLVILPIGGILMILWGRRIIKPVAKGIDGDKHIHLQGIAMKTFVYMIPAIICFGLFAVPVIYFGHLQKKESYCIEVIKVNKLDKNDPVLKERCDCLDIDELFEQAYGKSK